MIISSTASWPEVAWTIIALWGMAFHGWLWWKSERRYADIEAYKIPMSDGAVLLYNIATGQERDRFVISTFLFLIGITSMLRPAVSNTLHAYTIIITAAFFLMALYMNVTSIIYEMRRRRVFHEVKNGKARR